MTVLPIPVGQLQTNCYLVYTPPDQAVLIDPGDEATRILAVVREHGATVRAVLLTHAHFDHMMAAQEVSASLAAPLYAPAGDSEALTDGVRNLSALMGGRTCHVKADHLLSEGDHVAVGDITFQVLHTPGHTPGSVCYDVPEAGVLFSGDTLFYHSYGRTDFPGGSERDMVASLRRLWALPGDRKVYPGHGGPTTLAQERRCNPYAN